MALGQTQYLYMVELTALEEHLSHSMDRVARMHEKALRRKDFKAADRIHNLQRALNVAHRRTMRLQ